MVCKGAPSAIHCTALVLVPVLLITQADEYDANSRTLSAANIMNMCDIVA